MGTMDVNKQYCDLAFCFDFGLLGNKNPSSDVTLSKGSRVDIREYQFAIYPGYYNFCNEGMGTNDMKLGATNAVVATPNTDNNVKEKQDNQQKKDLSQSKDIKETTSKKPINTTIIYIVVVIGAVVVGLVGKNCLIK